MSARNHRLEGRWLKILRTIPVLPEIPGTGDWPKARRTSEFPPTKTSPTPVSANPFPNPAMKFNFYIIALVCPGFPLALTSCVSVTPARDAAAPIKRGGEMKDGSPTVSMKQKADDVTAALTRRGMVLDSPVCLQKDGRLLLHFQEKVPAGEYPPPGSDRFVWITREAVAVDQYGGPVRLH